MTDVNIFCRTYDGDAEWLSRALPTWIEHCKWVNSIVVTGIDAECSRAKEICGLHGVNFTADDESSGIKNGYINQQYTKMRADLFTDSEYVMFIDSDTICYGDNTADDFFTNGKPDLFYSEWDEVGQALCWRAPTKAWLGIDPPYEFMRRFPLTYSHDTIANCRKYMEEKNEKSLLEIMKGAAAISEFNLIGAYAWEFESHKFNWVHPEVDGEKPNPFKQYWSHGGLGQLDEG